MLKVWLLKFSGSTLEGDILWFYWLQKSFFLFPTIHVIICKAPNLKQYWDFAEFRDQIYSHCSNEFSIKLEIIKGYKYLKVIYIFNSLISTIYLISSNKIKDIFEELSSQHIIAWRFIALNVSNTQWIVS